MIHPYRIRQQGFFARLGLLCLIGVLFGGYTLAAGMHMMEHYKDRDGNPELSITDIKGAYHGVETPSALKAALERNHPPELPDDQRQILLDWINSDRISDDYDNLDLGDQAPAEIIAMECLSCHSNATADAQGAGVSLEYWTDVERIAHSRSIEAVDEEIQLISLHTHAPTMAVITIVVSLMALLLTGWPRWLVGLLVCVAGMALLVDLGSWLPARHEELFVWGIIVGGVVHTCAMVLLMLLVACECLLPRVKEDTPPPAA